jgi:hypothetical protein
MAEVYRAWDAKRAASVAIKLLNDDLAADAVFLRRFAREGHALARLTHPNVVRFLGFEQAPGLAFMVMEFIDGVTLRRFMGLLGRPLALSETMGVLQPICSALHYAHQMGVYHLDIKPANVFIEQGGRIVLGDFGIARLSESATVTLSSIGTPAYMSPEQAPGGRAIDGRSDIYSLAITTYEMLTTDRPFKGETGSSSTSLAERILWEHLNASPPPPRRANPQIPPPVENAIMRALAKDPAGRQQHVLQFYDEISRGAGVQPARITPEMVARRAATAAPTPTAPPHPVPQRAHQPAREPKTPAVRLRRPRGARTGWLAALAAAVVVAVAALVVAVVLRPWESIAEATPSTPPVTSLVAAETPAAGVAQTASEETVVPQESAAPAKPGVPQPTAEPSNVYVLYVLDAAEGMQKTLGSNTKLTAARVAIVDNLSHVLAAGPPVNAGLLTFGHRIRDPRDDGYCGDANVELLLPVLSSSAVTIRDTLETLRSEHGGAPLGNAITAAYREFRFTPDRVNAVVMIAGANTFCGDDPLTPVIRNAEVGQVMPIYVVGLTLENAGEADKLASVAAQSGGEYRNAATTAELVQVLAEFIDRIRGHA